MQIKVFFNAKIHKIQGSYNQFINTFSPHGRLERLTYQKIHFVVAVVFPVVVAFRSADISFLTMQHTPIIF